MRRILPGFLMTALLAAVAFVLATSPVAPFTLGNGVHPLGPSSVAILLGILLANTISPRESWAAGVRFCSRVILPIGIVLLGSRLAFGDLMKIGLTGLLLSLLSIGTCAVVVIALVRWFSLPVKLITLVGVGTAICGGSAIAAVAPVIEADEEDISWSVASVALLGLVAMFVLPILGHVLGLESAAFGVWAGLTIQQTPQVVAAGLAYGGDAGEVADLSAIVDWLDQARSPRSLVLGGYSFGANVRLAGSGARPGCRARAAGCTTDRCHAVSAIHARLPGARLCRRCGSIHRPSCAGCVARRRAASLKRCGSFFHRPVGPPAGDHVSVKIVPRMRVPINQKLNS